ncbi:alpha/beta fold hydrolase [Arthrobacter castelli]|uniref:alpha/beta fold hydrolase n=1 Tax=Arthrobacter castelli TaxID=271431 RepID=UPI0003F75134|nr:alpha/beta hydrolase [Arthrobacter castelli]
MVAPPLTDRATTHSTAVLGATVRYWDYSPADPSRSYPTIVMVHGFRGDHHGLLKIVAAMDQARIIVPDLPGFGASEPLAQTHNVANYSRCVRLLIEQLQLPDEVMLLGHSFGSVIASHAASASGRPPASLVLINPICEPALEGSKAFLSRVTSLYYRLCASLPERAGMFLLRSRVIVRVMSELMAHTKDRRLRRWIHAEHQRYFSAFANRQVVLESFQASITGTVRDVADQLDMPVLLIAAEDDDLGSVAGQRRLAGAISNSRLEILTGVGHLIHYEKPREAAGLMMEFLEAAQDGGQAAQDGGPP